MSQQNTSSFDALLKDVYRGPMIRSINDDTFLLDQIERGNVNNLGSYAGRRLIFPVATGRNRGRGAGVGNGGTLPVAGKQASTDAIVSICDFWQAVEMTDKVFRVSNKSEGAFVSALELEMTGAATDLRKDLNRVAWGTGDGLLASCTATQSATTISLDSGQYIAPGDTVDVLTRSTGAVKGAGLTVVSVTYTGTTDTSTQAAADVTLSGSVSVTAADGIYIAGDRANECDGLRNITAQGRTLHGIDSTQAANAVWDGNATAAAWANVSEDLLMKSAQRAKQRTGAGKLVDLYLASPGVQRRLSNTYTSQKRWTDANATKIDGGYSAIMVSAGGKPIPVVSDDDTPNGFVAGIRKDTFAWAEVDKPNWLQAPDQSGGIWHLKAAATAGQNMAAWQAYFGWYAALICTAPAANIQISQLKDDIPVARL